MATSLRPAWRADKALRRSGDFRHPELLTAGTSTAGAARQPLDVAVVQPALAGAALDNRVAGLHRAGREAVLAGQARVDRREVRRGGAHQLLVAVDDEIGLLVGVDAVARAHDPLEVEADAIGRLALRSEERRVGKGCRCVGA